MKKSVSILAIMLVGVMSAFPSNGAQMTSQIQRLLEQKEEKIKKLEECEGKKRGWMIAGISTIGVTAVGVGVNIAQANKSNKLSGEIDAAKTELERQQDRLNQLNSQIAQRQQAPNPGGDGEVSPVLPNQEVPDYSAYKLQCNPGGALFVFKQGDANDANSDFNRLNVACRDATGANMKVTVVDTDYYGWMNVVTVECEGYERSPVCQSNPNNSGGGQGGGGNGNQGGQGGGTPGGGANNVQSETPEEGRVDGAKCLTKDLPSHATVGQYITYGQNKLLCYNKTKTQTVKCSCAATQCGTGYELARNSNGENQGYCKAESNSAQGGSVGGAGDESNQVRINECFTIVRNYLLRECPKCVGEGGDKYDDWDQIGEGACDTMVNMYGGYNGIFWEGTDMDESGYTRFALRGKSGEKRVLMCPKLCGKI